MSSLGHGRIAGNERSLGFARDDGFVNIARTLGIRALTLFGVLVAVLVLLVVSLGATGYSDSCFRPR